MGPILKIISFTRHLWKWYIFMGIFVVIISLLSLVGPLLSKQIVDIIVAQLTGQPVEFSQFFVILILMISTDIFISTFTAFSQWMGDILTVRLQTYLSKKFYQHVLDLHIGYFDNEITGNIINKMYRGITSITEFMQNMLNNFLPFFLTAFVTIIILSRYSPVVGFLLAILFPIYIIISHGSTLAWQGFEQKKNYLADLSQGRVFESITGIRVVKSFAAQIYELASYLKNRRKIETLAIEQTKRWHLYDFGRRLCLNIILFAIFAYIVYWTFHKKFTIGEMTLLLQLVNQARFPLFAMSFILGQIQQASSGSQDFFKVISTENLIKDHPQAEKLIVKTKPGPDKPLIEFKNIYFNYDMGKKVLKNISVRIYPGEKLALVGESGEGKSTLVNLLLRYYIPTRGTILINDYNISKITQESLRQNIAVVFQESLLFSGSVYDNIRYSRPNASKREVIKAAVAANAHEFIKKLPQGYQSTIGERGVKLSGGQKQRIAIARAILKNAPIIILDEATSSLDSRSEMEVQKGLNHLLADRTSIIIAHRLSTIAAASHILVISGGRVAQYGKPGKLLADKKGVYAQMVELQRKLLTAAPEVKDETLKKFDLVG